VAMCTTGDCRILLRDTRRLLRYANGNGTGTNGDTGDDDGEEDSSKDSRRLRCCCPPNPNDGMESSCGGILVSGEGGVRRRCRFSD